MAALTSHLETIEIWRTRAREQTAELQSLADALAREGAYLYRSHQADIIIALRNRVKHDVEATLLAEDEAQSDFSRRKERRALFHHVVGPLVASLTGNELYREHNARLAQAELASSPPFRTVVVQIAAPGIPDGVSIVSLSRLARESGTSVSEIRARLEARGIHLLAPALFSHLLDSLQRDVLKGSAALPLTCEEFAVYTAANMPKRKRIYIGPATAVGLLPRPGLPPGVRPMPKGNANPPGGSQGVET